jgi:hypothetical protein
VRGGHPVVALRSRRLRTSGRRLLRMLQERGPLALGPPSQRSGSTNQQRRWVGLEDPNTFGAWDLSTVLAPDLLSQMLGMDPVQPWNRNRASELGEATRLTAFDLEPAIRARRMAFTAVHPAPRCAALTRAFRGRGARIFATPRVHTGTRAHKTSPNAIRPSDARITGGGRGCRHRRSSPASAARRSWRS